MSDLEYSLLGSEYNDSNNRNSSSGNNDNNENAAVEDASRTTKQLMILEAVVLSLAFLEVFFAVVGTPLPIIVFKDDSIPSEITLFDHFKNSCSDRKHYYRAAGAFAFFSEFLAIGILVLLVREMSNRAVHQYAAIGAIGMQFLISMLPWTLVAAAFNKDACDNLKVSHYGGGFGLLLMVWLLHIAVIGLYALRRMKQSGQLRYTIFEAFRAAGQRVEVSAETHGTRTESTMSGGVKEWAKYVEYGVQGLQVTLTVLIIIAIPEEMYSVKDAGVTMFGAIPGCKDDQHKARFAGACAFFSVIFSSLNIVLLFKEYGDGMAVLHKYFLVGMQALQSLFMMIVWAVIASIYNKTACSDKLKNPKDLPDATYEGAFTMFLLCWLLHMGIVAAYIVRKQFGGIKVCPGEAHSHVEEEGLQRHRSSSRFQRPT